MGSAVGSIAGSALGGMVGGPMGAQLGGSIGGSLFGGGGGGGVGGGMGMSREAIAEAKRRADQTYFKPYTVTSATGSTSYDPNSGYQTTLSAPYQQIMGTALGGAGDMFARAAAFDPSARAAEVYGEQAALLQPQFEQQATALQSRLFGGGRLGLRLAGEGAGLGAGSGMVQPDALGLGQAQQQTLAQLAANARTQAFGEQAQLGQFAQGLLGAGTQISELERLLMSQGLDAETARSNAAAMAGKLATGQFSDAVSAQNRAQQNQQNLISGIAGGFSGGFGTASGGFGSGLTNKIGTARGLFANYNDPYKVGGTFGD